MVSKIGYGVFAQCLMHGTPLLYPPRQDFAEFPVLEEAMLDWGHAYPLCFDDYCALNWENVLAHAAKRGRPLPRDSNGAKMCAKRIEGFIGGR
ncbi:MAG TPA: hypothetical protein VLS90_13695, partial [Thermodesulfobacteriota bacterium]|nr:hypothetical protein [Thermodesulfobacteriota bacterium]